VLTDEEAADLVTYAVDDSIYDELSLCRVTLRRLMMYLKEHPDLKPREVAAIAPLVFGGARTVAALVKLHTGQAQTFAEILGEALNELGGDFKIKL